MQWFDQISLPAIIALPLIGAVFLLFIPENDLSLRKRVAVLIVAATGIFHIRNSILFFKNQAPTINLDPFMPVGFNGTLFLRLDEQAFIGISFVIVLLFLFLHCSLTKNTLLMQLNSKILFLLSLTSTLMLISNLGVFLLGQLVITQTVLVLNLREGGSQRASSSVSTCILLFFVDLAAFLAWRWQADLSILDPRIVAFVIYLPTMTRLLVPFFSPWARLFFANSTVEITILYLSTSFIPATVALARSHADISFIAPVAMISAVFGTLVALGDKHLSQFLMRLMGVGGSLALFAFATPISHVSSSPILAYCGMLTMLVCLGLLVQRAMGEEIPEKFEKTLRPAWYAVLMLLSGAPFMGVGAFIWQIFPSDSFIWMGTYALMSFATFSRARILSVIRAPVNPTPTSYTRATILNLWSCIAIVILMTLAMQMLIS